MLLLSLTYFDQAYSEVVAKLMAHPVDYVECGRKCYQRQANSIGHKWNLPCSDSRLKLYFLLWLHSILLSSGY